MDRFFDGTFITYGIEVISFAQRDQEDRIDPMVYIFPRMTKCIFHKFGRSGEVEKHDAMCILPLNIVNEKIYIFLWFWMLLLLILTLLVVFYRQDNILIILGTISQTKPQDDQGQAETKVLVYIHYSSKQQALNNVMNVQFRIGLILIINKNIW